MHLAASSGDKSLSMASNVGGLGRSGRRKYGGVEGAGVRFRFRSFGIGERRVGGEKMLLGGGVGEFSRLLFPPFSTVERWTTAPRATGGKYMMAITNLDVDVDVDVDVNGKALASTELW